MKGTVQPVRSFVPALLLPLLLLLSACSSVPLRTPLPDSLAETAVIEGIPNARFWGDEMSPYLEAEMNTMSQAEIRTAFPALYGQDHDYLALSGGGANGAYGAGLLVGWSKTGTRPEFQMVTGISAGALIAPFAFAGSDYDETLTAVFTGISTSDILEMRSVWSLLSSDAAADTAPLRKLLEQYVTPVLLADIATQHRRGRGLYIGTTDADYMRPRIWDIGAIAASGQDGAIDLVREIMIASASIPGVMPPVRIEVQADGQSFDELHVDGGTSNQVFVYPASTDWRRVLEVLDVQGTPNVWVVRNGSMVPQRDVIEPELLPLTARSISSLIRTQGIGDLNTIFLLSRRDGTAFHLTYIPDDFTLQPDEPFDTDYMRQLYARGYDFGRSGAAWDKAPPGWELAATAVTEKDGP